MWLTAPDGKVTPIEPQHIADKQGMLVFRFKLSELAPQPAAGIWSINAQAPKSGLETRAFFDVSTYYPPQSDPSRLTQVLQDKLRPSGDTIIGPLAGPAGTRFVALARGFTLNEKVSAWLTLPDGTSQALLPAALSWDKDGALRITVESGALSDGIYTIAVQSIASQTLRSAPFMVTRDFIAGPGTQRPPSVNGSVKPLEGPPGTTFQLRGQGLKAREPVEFWYTDPAGNYTLSPTLLSADAKGRIGYEPAFDLTASGANPRGVYGYHFRGQQSKVRVDLYLSLLPEQP